MESKQKLTLAVSTNKTGQTTQIRPNRSVFSHPLQFARKLFLWTSPNDVITTSEFQRGGVRVSGSWSRQQHAARARAEATATGSKLSLLNLDLRPTRLRKIHPVKSEMGLSTKGYLERGAGEGPQDPPDPAESHIVLPSSWNDLRFCRSEIVQKIL